MADVERKRLHLLVELDLDRYAAKNQDATQQNVMLLVNEMKMTADKYGIPLRIRVGIEYFDPHALVGSLGLPAHRTQGRLPE